MALLVVLLIPDNFLSKEKIDEKIVYEKRDVDYNEYEPDLSVTTKQNVTTCDTVYEVDSYIGSRYIHSVEAIPFSFTGLTREELEKEIKRYEISPTFADKHIFFFTFFCWFLHPPAIIIIFYRSAKQI